jgi:mRNA-degrading endonuclease toxin of MazEF toxin-antitoxin module
MHKIQPKDIWIIHLPDTQANEQTGVRPALILAVHFDTAISVVVPLTKNLETLRFEYTYKIANLRQMG